MYSYGPPHMAKQKQGDQLEHTYSNYVRIRDVTLKTCQKPWMIRRSGERGSGISVLAARLDDEINQYIYWTWWFHFLFTHHRMKIIVWLFSTIKEKQIFWKKSHQWARTVLSPPLPRTRKEIEEKNNLISQKRFIYHIRSASV